MAKLAYDRVLCHVIYINITPDYFNWYCCKDVYIRIFDLVVFDLRGCKRQDKLNPLAFKAWFYIRLIRIGTLTFGIGTQHKTWFSIRNENIYGLYLRWKNSRTVLF